MNLDELEKNWSRQAVTGPTVLPREIATGFERELKAARRRFTGMIVMAVGLLLLGWTMATVAHVTGIKRLTALETTAHVVGSGFYLGWLGLAVRSKRAVQREVAAMGGTAGESAAASLRVVELQIGNYRIAAWSLPLAVVAASLLSLAKFSRGELHGWGAVASTGFVVVLASLVGVAMWWRYRRELKPRREELRRMLEALGEDREV